MYIFCIDVYKIFQIYKIYKVFQILKYIFWTIQRLFCKYVSIDKIFLLNISVSTHIYTATGHKKKNVQQIVSRMCPYWHFYLNYILTGYRELEGDALSRTCVIILSHKKMPRPQRMWKDEFKETKRT